MTDELKDIIKYADLLANKLSDTLKVAEYNIDKVTDVSQRKKLQEALEKAKKGTLTINDIQCLLKN